MSKRMEGGICHFLEDKRQSRLPPTVSGQTDKPDKLFGEMHEEDHCHATVWICGAS